MTGDWNSMPNPLLGVCWAKTSSHIHFCGVTMKMGQFLFDVDAIFPVNLDISFLPDLILILIWQILFIYFQWLFLIN